ncbi:hypothetical protein PO124_14170 [Bacillus licheniformis]|nr:hypothetical protein [Bacillus licheniformis]
MKEGTTSDTISKRDGKSMPMSRRKSHQTTSRPYQSTYRKHRQDRPA